MPDFWNDPNSDWTRDWHNAGQAFTDAGTALGFIPKNVDPNAPGASLDTSNADEERARLGPLLAQLQQQAATGAGAWESALKNNLQQSGNMAEAVGQSNTGGGYASQLRGIGEAQAGIAQRGAGQENILRAQAKTGAQDQLSGLLAAQGQGDAAQAAAQAAAAQGTSELQQTLNRQASKNTENATGAIGNAFVGGSKMSDGGPVPGTPKVFGDDEKNDTVPAMLSPGEIVIPRSHAGSPEAAAEFVRALHASKGIRHFDGGGKVGDGTGLSNQTSTDPGTDAAQIFLPHVGQAMANAKNGPAAPTIQNGGLLDTRNYDSNRSAALQNDNLLAGSSQGNGPSVAGQQFTNASDANIDAAMHGGGLGRLVGAQSGAAGEGAATVGNEQARGQAALLHALTQQRAQDQAMAQAQQQAAFRQTQMNAGLDLQQQAQLRGLLAGAGQAAAGYSQLGGGKDSYSLNNTNTPAFDMGTTDASADQPGGWENPYDTGPDRGGASDISGGENFAEGGRVQTAPRRAPRPLSKYADRVVPGAIFMENGEDPKLRKVDDSPIGPDELGVQRAMGGVVEAISPSNAMASGGEAKKAAAFLKALRASR